MRDRTFVMVTRVDLIGMVEAEPMVVERFPDGSAEIQLDDGELVQLSPVVARSVGYALLGLGEVSTRPSVGPITGEAA